MTAEEKSGAKMGPLDTEPGPASAGVNAKLEDVTIMKVMRNNEGRRAMFSVVPTLTLGIIGGAVLPLAWAFSVTGVICGLLIMVLVAAANAYTSDLLLRQAYITGTHDYENLAEVIGGKWWRLGMSNRLTALTQDRAEQYGELLMRFRKEKPEMAKSSLSDLLTTEISIVILLVGSIIGSLAQIGEVGSVGLLAFRSDLPNWLVGSHGRVIIAFATIAICAPLCLANKLRQLEYAGVAGTAVVIWLMFTVVVNSIQHGLPSLSNKQLPIVGFTSIGNVTQAVSIFGFAFYIQPMMMPMLGEVPQNNVGVKIVSYSTRIVVLVNAFVIYFVTGFFGAAYYGQNTQSNILDNQWLGGGVAQGCLNIAMAVYLAVANPVLEYPTRYTINGWIPERLLRGKWARHLTITALILGVSMAVALAVPSNSGQILTVTGATGVCLVSYLIPVVNHLLLHFNRSKLQKELLAKTMDKNAADLEVNKGEAPLTYRRDRSGNHCWGVTAEYLRDVVLPLVVATLGVFCSGAALSTL